ncbi:MAG: lamin tail domain-containing protein, partial [Candidatus Latescibacterota bacterium]
TDKAIGSRGLSNSNPEPVYFLSAAGDTLSLVRYPADCPAGHSWERMISRGGDGMENFRPSREPEGTPGRHNSVTPPDRNPALVSSSLRYEPASPRMGEGLDIFVSCRNGGLASLSGVRVSVRLLPDTPVGVAEFPDEILPGADAPPARMHLSSLPGGLITLMAFVEGEISAAEDDTVLIELNVPLPAGTVILNEVMAAPREGPEWIELFNTASVPVSVKGWKVSDSRGVPSEGVKRDVYISAGGYALIAAGATESPAPDGTPWLAVNGFPALNNDGDTVHLLDHSGTMADSVEYTSTTAGFSLELISPRLRGSASAWDFCTTLSGSTPGARNSIYFSRADDQALNGGTGLTISPNPFPEATTISYDLPFPLARVRLTVYDRRGRFVAAVRDAAESGSAWTGTWDGRSGGNRLPIGPYILCFEALNKNTGEMVTIRKAIVVAKKR